MKIYKCLSAVVTLLLMGSFSVPVRAAMGPCSPKVDNFILFADQSGSMCQLHHEAGEIKEHLVKTLLGQMNEQIPLLAYKGGVAMFAPFEDGRAQNRRVEFRILDQ